MYKALLLFIVVSSYSYAQNIELPDGINRRIGSELDSTEAEYFGLFSWVKGFKSGMITNENNELHFRISRSSSGDTVFAFSKKNSEYLDYYVNHYEEIFTNPEVQKSIDWTGISPYLRPGNPIREAGEISIEMFDKTVLERQLIWVGDSLLVVWNDDSSVSLNELETKIEVIPFDEVAYINNQAVLGNQTAFVNNVVKIRNKAFFSKLSPELNRFLKNHGRKTTASTMTNDKEPQLNEYSDVKAEYLKNFTIGLSYKFTMYNDAEQVYIEYEDIYSELVSTRQNWGGELLYNINPMFSIGAEYGEISYLEYTRSRALLQDPFSRDVLSGDEFNFLCRIRPKPRDPIVDNLESEIGLSFGRGNYAISTESYNSSNTLRKAVRKASPWTFSIQFGYSYFFTNYISVYGGMLFRSSTSFEITDANNFKNSRSVKFTQANSFIALRVHPW